MSAVGAPSALPAARSTWIVGSAYDQLFLVAGWAVPLVLVALFTVHPLLAIVTFAVVFDGGHVGATAPLTIFDRTTDHESRRFYYVGAATILGLAGAVTVAGGMAGAIWRSVYLYWGAFHILRQHYGFLRLYQLRSVSTDPVRSRVEIWCLYVGLLALYTWMFQPQSARTTADLLTPIVPLFVPAVLGTLWLALAGALAALVLRDARAGRSVGWIRLAHLGLCISNWALAGYATLAFHSILVGVMVITSYHGAQYHGLIWHVGERRYGAGSGQGVWRHLFRRDRVWLFALLAVMFGFFRFVLFGFMGGREFFFRHGGPRLADFALNAAWGLTFVHYLFDGRMWQLRRNPQLRRDLEVARPAVPAANADMAYSG